MDAKRKKWLYLLLVVSGIVHFFHLTYPAQVIFDEFHFGKFASAYCCGGNRFFDIHPPHGKLLIAGAAKLLGYEGNFLFSRIGESYVGPGLFGLRLVPALAGTILPGLVFILLTQLGVTSAGAFLGGAAIVFDNALLVQSRYISLDLILVCSILASLSTLLAYFRAQTTLRRVVFLSLSGMLAGLAVGVKFTGLVVVLILTTVIWRVVDPRSTRTILPVLRIGGGALLSGLLVYGAGWVLHFHLLKNPGRGDLFYKPQGKFLKDTTETHKRMLASNMNLKKSHSDGSRWWQWPLMKNPIYYWAEGNSRIYFIGNPVVWWTSSFFMLGLLCYVLLNRLKLLATPNPRQSARFLWIPLLAFWGAFLPYILISRVLFMYHYLTALVFAVITTVAWLDSLGWMRNGGPALQDRAYYAVLGSILAGFWLVSPLTFGYVSFDWHHEVLRYLFVVL